MSIIAHFELTREHADEPGIKAGRPPMLHDALERHLKDVFAVVQGDLRDGQEQHVARDGSVHWEKVGKEIGFQKVIIFCLYRFKTLVVLNITIMEM